MKLAEKILALAMYADRTVKPLFMVQDVLVHVCLEPLVRLQHVGQNVFFTQTALPTRPASRAGVLILVPMLADRMPDANLSITDQCVPASKAFKEIHL